MTAGGGNRRNQCVGPMAEMRNKLSIFQNDAYLFRDL